MRIQNSEKIDAATVRQTSKGINRVSLQIQDQLGRSETANDLLEGLKDASHQRV